MEGMFNLAMQWGFLEKNPCQTIKKMKKSGGKERYLSQDEIKRLFKALESYPENPSADAIKFLLLTGMRMTEALTLTWDNVDLEVGHILEETKAGKSRTVVLNDLAKGRGYSGSRIEGRFCVSGQGDEDKANGI